MLESSELDAETEILLTPSWLGLPSFPLYKNPFDKYKLMAGIVWGQEPTCLAVDPGWSDFW